MSGYPVFKSGLNKNIQKRIWTIPTASQIYLAKLVRSCSTWRQLVDALEEFIISASPTYNPKNFRRLVDNRLKPFKEEGKEKFITIEDLMDRNQKKSLASMERRVKKYYERNAAKTINACEEEKDEQK